MTIIDSSAKLDTAMTDAAQLARAHEAANAPHETKPKRLISDYVGPVVGFAIFIGLWYFVSDWALQHLWHKPKFLVPEPHVVLRESLKPIPRADMLRGLAYTSEVVFIGLAISVVLGMGLAIAMAQARWLERSVWPYLIALQAVPILALVPTIGVIFGYELNSRVLVCVIISIFPIVSNTLFGLLSVDQGQHDLFTLRNASTLTRLRKLQLPAAMPSIFTGFRISAGLSVIGAIVGELFFVRGEKGIGILLSQYRSRNIQELAFGAMILSALLGIAVFIMFGLLSKLVVGRWYVATRKSGG